MARPTTTDATFAVDVLEKDGFVGVSFEIPRAVACQVFAAALGKVAADLQGQMPFFVMNGLRNPKAKEQWGIVKYPTFLLFYKGACRAKMVGAVSAPALKDWIERNKRIDEAPDSCRIWQPSALKTPSP